MAGNIQIIGAKEHNLQNINLNIPKEKLIIITGLSGSGKSSLAFNTIYAEGQRRYIESLSSYARQFLDRIAKPDIDKIEGLTPCIAIDQKTTSKNPRSTVGTITEIYDYLRLFYARIGEQHCHLCLEKISKMNVSDIINQVLSLPKNSKVLILAPLVREKKGSFTDLLESLREKGYVRVLVDGTILRLDEDIELSKTKKHTIKLVVDRLTLKEENKDRIVQDIEKTLKIAYGELELEILNYKELGLKNKLIHYSEHLACFACKVSFEALEPLNFSFNSPKGACEDCDGLGIKYSIDIEKLIDNGLSIGNGAIKALYGFNKTYYFNFIKAFCKEEKIDINKNFSDLDEYQKKIILYGNNTKVNLTWKRKKLTRTWEGVVSIIYNNFKDDKSLSDYMSEKICSTCKGNRLNKKSLAVKVAGKTIAEFINMPIEDSSSFFKDFNNFKYLDSKAKIISKPIIQELKDRLFFLNDVGLGYLSLSRDARSISGGEAQRIRIASQIGSGLTGVTYILDEPSIGLHERDTMKLIKTLQSLKEKGNTVIVVEHDKETIKSADYIIDIGPKAGKFGGEVIFSGLYKDLIKTNTLTAQYLNKKKKIEYFYRRKQEHWIRLKNININNIKNLNLSVPLMNFVCVTGLSGSGKSSLILQALLPQIKKSLSYKTAKDVKELDLDGFDNLDKIIYLDQSPIGRTPRSNPATYTGLMDEIRKVFSQTKEAKIRGYQIGRFSFNVSGGRCEKCQGDGEIKIEMHFLPDIMVKCDSCKGKRYNRQTLEVEYKSKNIADVLDMTVDEAFDFFKAIPRIKLKLETLKKVGLGYISLGQNAVTLSGGEAQRIKISKELSKKDTGKTLYILDEPTTGLHFDDVNKLVGVLHNLVELNNTVLVIEHNLDLIKNADYIIDMGPEGGSKGGKIVDMGSPEELILNYKKTKSYTAKFLASELKT